MNFPSNLPIPQIPGSAPSFEPIEDAPAGHGMSLTQVLSILRARSVLIGATLLIMLASAAAYIKLMPMNYVATATLIVNGGGGTADPLADRGFMGADQNTYIPTQIELIKSNVVLMQVVDQLHLTQDNEFGSGIGGSSNAVREATVRNLSKGLLVERGQGSQLIYISMTAKRPEKAARIANAIADQYLAQSVDRATQPAGARAERYSSQLAELRQKATEAQDRVTAFRKEHGMTDDSIDKSDMDIAALNDLENKLLAAQNDRRSLESKQLAAGTTSEIVLNSPAIGALRGKLAADTANMANLRATLGPKHPTVLELQSSIDSTQQTLDKEIRAISVNYNDQLNRARELEANYTKARDEARARVLVRRGVQDQAAKLLLELQSAQSTYKSALDGYDKILFASTGNYTNVSLVSRADPPVKAEKPNKPKLMIMATGLSFGVAFGWPIAFELFLSRRLRCRDDFERHFGIPVLAQFGSLPLLAARHP